MSEAKTFPPWYERMGVQFIAQIQGEKGFRYEIGIKEDEVGTKYVYIAKVVPSGNYAKSLMRIPLKVAKEIAQKILELG